MSMQLINKRITQSVLTISVIISSIGVCQAVELKVGTINSNKIIQSYPKSQKLMQDLAKSESDLNKKVLEKKAALEKAKSENKTQTELQMMAEQMRLEIEPEAKKLEAESNARSEEVETSIKTAIDTVAKENKYDLILTEEAVLFGGTDVSDLVLKKLGTK
jgi:outer membrane protein